MYFTRYPSPLGELVITANEQGLTSLTFSEGKKTVNLDHSFQENTAVFRETCQQLDQYFSGDRAEFSLPLAPEGTEFQKKVWQALTLIKQGETKTYGWIAERINNVKAVRAVGAANGANPIALIIPCHRVIGSNGKLTGYAGGLGLKAKLLMHEGANFRP